MFLFTGLILSPNSQPHPLSWRFEFLQIICKRCPLTRYHRCGRSKNMTFKSCFVEQSIPAHTAEPSHHVPSRIRLIEHSLNWINHILHAGAQAPVKSPGLGGSQILGFLLFRTVSNPKPGRVPVSWFSAAVCCHISVLISMYACTKPTDMIILHCPTARKRCSDREIISSTTATCNWSRWEMINV